MRMVSEKRAVGLKMGVVAKVLSSKFSLIRLLCLTQPGCSMSKTRSAIQSKSHPLMTMTELEKCSFSERLTFLSLTRAASSHLKTMNSLQSDRHPPVTMKKIENFSFCERLSDDETFSLLHLLALTFAVVDSSTHVFSLTQAVFSWSQTKKLLQTECCPLTTMKKIATESFSARLIDNEPVSPLHSLIVELISSICLLHGGFARTI